MTRLSALLLLTTLHGGAWGAELGRLFLSPADRIAIDLAHRGATVIVVAPDPLPDSAGMPTATTQDPASVAPVTVNGYIARSAGPATVWVNGSDAHGGSLSAAGRDGRRVRVPLGDGAGQVALKPGQSFDPGSRQVSDAYEQRPRPRE